MHFRFNRPCKCGDDRIVILPEHLAWRAPEIRVSAAEPIGEPQVRHMRRLHLLEALNDGEDAAMTPIELRQRIPGRATALHAEQRLLRFEGLQFADRILRGDAQDSPGFYGTHHVDRGKGVGLGACAVFFSR